SMTCMIRMAVMCIMHGMLNMLALFPARLAVEGQEHQTPTVKACQQGCKNTDPESHCAQAASGKGGFQYAIFGIEAGKAEYAINANAGDGQRAHHHRPIGERDLFTQAAIIAHILLVMHGMNDRACTQEQ